MIIKTTRNNKEKEFYVLSGLAKMGMSLIKWVLTSKVSWYKIRIWFWGSLSKILKGLKILGHIGS